MVRRRERRLVALNVSRAKEPGMYPDGNGLYLRVGPNGAKAWVLRYRFGPKRHEMGLGPFPTVSLAQARDKADTCRRQRAEGTNPLEVRRAAQRARQTDSAHTMTFRQCAEAYIAAHSPSWKNPKHAQQWPNSLATYAYPVFGELPVADVDTVLIMRVLEPIWQAKPETASRVRGRIEAILDWARARHFRTGENPARWRGHLDTLLPHTSKLARVKHHAALPYIDVSAFLAALREQVGIAARALEFTILTAARTNETIGARWEEIDGTKAMWIVPAERMKGRREHRVPLSKTALSIIDQARELRLNDFIFPGFRKGQPLSNMAMLQLLTRMGRDDVTVHGFRSTFRDWAAECTNFPNEVAEAALAHVVGNKAEAAYRRGDLFEKRGHLMEAWARYCAKPARAEAAVLPIGRAVHAAKLEDPAYDPIQ